MGRQQQNLNEETKQRQKQSTLTCFDCMHIIVNWPETKLITLNSVIVKWLTAKQIDGFIHGWLPQVSMARGAICVKIMFRQAADNA